MALTLQSVPVKRTNLHLPRRKIRSTHEAMVIFAHTHAKEIKRGREVARLIALKKGTVTAREMVEYMIAEGSFVEGKSERWASSVFRYKEWVWTGQWVYDSKSKNTQGGLRGIKVWRLKKKG